MCCFGYSAWYLLAPRNRRSLDVLLGHPMVFFVLYTTLCLASTIWSSRPLYSAFMAFQCYAIFLLIATVLCELNRKCPPQEVVEWITLWAIWAILWDVVLMVHWSGLGFLLYPFYAARFSSGVFFFMALCMSKRRLFSWAIVAFAILSLANKTYFGLLPGLLLGAIIGNSKIKVLVFFIAGVLIIAVLYLGAERVALDTLFYGQKGVGWEYTSGRDTMWKTCWEVCMERPMTGYGFVAGERDILYETRGSSVISMHSMLFSSFMGVGIFGPILLTLYFVGTGILCFFSRVPPHWKFAFVSTICMVFTISMTSPGIGGRVYGAWLPSVIVMTTIAVLCRKTHKSQQLLR